MENPQYYNALKDGNYSLLEELADSAGYNDDFNIMFARILNRNDGEEFKFWRTTGYDVAYAFAPSLRHRMAIIEQIKENPPRAYWNNKWKNVYTKIKKEGGNIKFIDLWKDKEQNKNAIATGIFPQKSDKMYHDDCDEETNKILHISSVRSKYPPLTPWKEIIGIPDSGSVPLYFAMKRVLDFGIGTMAYLIVKNPFFILGAIGLMEYGVYKIKEQQRGIPAFKKLGVKLDKDAIDDIIAGISI